MLLCWLSAFIRVSIAACSNLLLLLNLADLFLSIKFTHTETKITCSIIMLIMKILDTP